MSDLIKSKCRVTCRKIKDKRQGEDGLPFKKVWGWLRLKNKNGAFSVSQELGKDKSAP